MKIIFFGTGEYVLPVLEVLKSDFELALVLTTEKSGPVLNFCKTNSIEALPVTKLTEDVISKIKDIEAPVAVLANFGLIVPQSVLDIFPKGIINIHPSLLPKFRGPTPGQSAILSGEKKTGVTIMKLDKEIDHGEILSQQEEQILTEDTADTLYTRLFKIGSQMLAEVLPIYIKGRIELKEQDHSKATFTKTLTRDSGFIDLSGQLSIANGQLSRMIRAFFPWPGVWTKAKLGNTEKRIMLLPDKKIQVEGKKPMPYKDFVNGYKEGKEILSKLPY